PQPSRLSVPITNTVARQSRSAGRVCPSGPRRARQEETPITQAQLISSVADALGESPRTVHHLGFRLVVPDPDDLEPDDLRLVVACPFWRVPMPYPGVARDGSLPMGECPGCDVYFPFAIDEVYAAGVDRGDVGPASREVGAPRASS